MKKILFCILATLAVTACRTDRTPPTADELFACVPAESETVVGINLDSCSFVSTLVPEAVLDYVSHNDAVLFTVYSDGTEPVMMLRATNPVKLAEAAYDWMQAPIEGSDGQHLLSMYTRGDVTTFTDSRFVWTVRSDHAKDVMKAVLNAPRSATAAALLRRTPEGHLRDAASGRITIDETAVPMVAHVSGNTLQLLCGNYVDNAPAMNTDALAEAKAPAPGVTATLDGTTATQVLRRFTSGLSLTQQLAINTIVPYVERAKSVDIKAMPDAGITITMHFDRKVVQATEVEETIAKLAASAGYHGMVDSTPDNGVSVGPIEVPFDCQLAITVQQDTAPTATPSFAAYITTPSGLKHLLETAPF